MGETRKALDQRIHLVCNAHIDPMWLWEWQEAAGEALSTFRSAAAFCEEFPEFVFNHNEALLYMWVEEHDPQLFRRIQRLVVEGRWHVMGGWHVQPDCNMPSGESLMRQALTGRRYFRERFGVEPTTAINFDSFGHSRGLVQILRKCGYDSYIHCRPSPEECRLPGEDYVWVGYDGSEVVAHRSDVYVSRLGKARKKVTDWIRHHGNKQVGLVLWGVGNHGGGPSRMDLRQLEQMRRAGAGPVVKHSTPEAYFAELDKTSLPRHEADVNPFAVGCYTSQALIKQKHRRLENELYSAEKMLSAAAIQGTLEYPHARIKDASEALLTAQFHDILPGSTAEPAKEAALQMLDHGLAITGQLKACAFFELAARQASARRRRFPLLVYNPHPFPVKGVVVCEFCLADVGFKQHFESPVVYHKGHRIPSQPERESGNFASEFRKRVAFLATLQPSQVNQFDCRMQVLPERPRPRLKARHGQILFRNPSLEVVVDCQTGLITKYAVEGYNFLGEPGLCPLVIKDRDDAWGLSVREFRRLAGRFRLMSPQAGSRFSGVAAEIPSVRVIEDGPVRSIVEALFSYCDSRICAHYVLPKQGHEIEVALRILWTEKMKMLKLSIPTVLAGADYLGQVAYGTDLLPNDGREVVAQKWVAARCPKSGKTLTVINDSTYGSDFRNGEVRISLLRSPAYAADPGPGIGRVPQDRWTARIDQGEFLFHFWIRGGDQHERLAHVDREALTHNERPFTLAYAPPKARCRPQPLMVLDDDVVQCASFKQCEDPPHYIVRLFEPTGLARKTTLRMPALGIQKTFRIRGFEIKTLIVDPGKRTVRETEEPAEQL